MMTKKDYQKIAELCGKYMAYTDADCIQDEFANIQSFTEDLMDLFGELNPAFVRSKFIKIVDNAIKKQEEAFKHFTK